MPFDDTQGKPEDKRSARSEREEKILRFWKDNQIFEKSLEKKSPEGDFVFYDGPPFATGLPHHGSLLSSIIKDVVPRYKTMRGFHVDRRWGWDCHGLPIENMVEKELGIKSKKEIEVMGVDKFNKACRDSVLRYVNEWKKFVDRVGRFVDFDNSYKTMDNSFIESVWWGLSEMNKKGLLYEGRKVLLYCPHCETPLAKAEIAMDHSYRDVTEESVYVKFKIIGFPDAYFLAWTTTPWTLPGNVALAVGPEIIYVEAKVGNEILVLAKERLSVIKESYEIVAEHKGSEMVGMQYEPLYEISGVKDSQKKSHYVAQAGFVNVEDGTGIVHTAVLYGEDDYELGLKLDLPMIPLLDQSAHFNSNAPEFIRGQYFKKAEKAVKEDLETRGLLLRREMHTHSYPHCHRCGTALLYNALSSWFINIQKVKSKMLKLNEKINWIPEHLKHGRFKNNLESAPDWTISRNRYWASPLPIWKDENGKVFVVDSVEMLKKYTKKSGNKYFAVRHGESEKNIKNICDSTVSSEYHLTEKGRGEAEQAGKKLKKQKIDLIICSPFLRTRETAGIIAEQIGFDKKDILIDDRLFEIRWGDFEDGPYSAYLEYEKKEMKTYDHPLPNGESYQDAKNRVGELLYEVDSKYKDKNILFVSHGILLEVLPAIIEGADAIRSKEIIDTLVVGTGEILECDFVRLPHNENFELDLHRPYIDRVELVSPESKPLKRIPEVIDGWVESGSMPFASNHYPFENKKEFKKNFPADFIAEYIAQTRTWFYYMHVVATTLFDDISFKNVVTTGNILATDGSKMSKSKGNYTDPMIIFDSFGADSMRYYLMSSVVMQAEDIRFVDDEVKQVHNQVLNILWNSFKFYEIYKDTAHSENPLKSPNVLDQWIVFRLNQLVDSTTKAMDAYDTVRATRPMKEFISDFSTWYIRRSRDRFKGDNEEDRAFALGTTRFVLLELSKLIAPIMPFIAEDIYQEIKSSDELESIHLHGWPKSGRVDEKLIKNMERTRAIVSQALEARSKANIKVRQPLASLSANLDGAYADLIKDEVNVKLVVDKNIEGVELDTNITEELAEEGKVRDIIRAIQEMRKEKNLKPSDKMDYEVKEDKELFEKYKTEIEKTTNIRVI